MPLKHPTDARQDNEHDAPPLVLEAEVAPAAVLALLLARRRGSAVADLDEPEEQKTFVNAERTQPNGIGTRGDTCRERGGPVWFDACPRDDVRRSGKGRAGIGEEQKGRLDPHEFGLNRGIGGRNAPKLGSSD